MNSVAVAADGSRFIVAPPADTAAYLLAGDEIRPFAHHETEHFTVTRDFLTDHRRALRALLDEERTSAGRGRR